MAEKKTYPKGITAFAPNNGAPSFIKGSIIITPKDLTEWLDGLGKEFLVDSKYGKQLKLQLTEYQGKLSLSVDTWKPTGQSTQGGIRGYATVPPEHVPDEDPENSLPF